MSAEEKRAWRRLVAQAFQEFHLIDAAERKELDEEISSYVQEGAANQNVRILLGFAHMPDEPDLSPFFREWVRDGGRLALPVWLGKDRMIFREIDDWESQLRPGRGGILEPVADRPEIAPAEIGMAVVPGRAFSEKRDRLGRGAGCYDALFRAQPGIFKIGVAYDFQIFPWLPTDDEDVSMDAVVTPRWMAGGLRWFKGDS